MSFILVTSTPFVFLCRIITLYFCSKSTMRVYYIPLMTEIDCDNVNIVYLAGITLVALLIPITVGMYVKRRWPLVAKKILKVGMFYAKSHFLK